MAYLSREDGFLNDVLYPDQDDIVAAGRQVHAYAQRYRAWHIVTWYPHKKPRMSWRSILQAEGRARESGTSNPHKRETVCHIDNVGFSYGSQLQRQDPNRFPPVVIAVVTTRAGTSMDIPVRCIYSVRCTNVAWEQGKAYPGQKPPAATESRFVPENRPVPTEEPPPPGRMVGPQRPAWDPNWLPPDDALDDAVSVKRRYEQLNKSPWQRLVERLRGNHPTKDDPGGGVIE